jgi:hypothetical protein
VADSIVTHDRIDAFTIEAVDFCICRSNHTEKVTVVKRAVADIQLTPEQLARPPRRAKPHYLHTCDAGHCILSSMKTVIVLCTQLNATNIGRLLKKPS